MLLSSDVYTISGVHLVAIVGSNHEYVAAWAAEGRSVPLAIGLRFERKHKLAGFAPFSAVLEAPPGDLQVDDGLFVEAQWLPLLQQIASAARNLNLLMT